MPAKHAADDGEAVTGVNEANVKVTKAPPPSYPPAEPIVGLREFVARVRKGEADEALTEQALIGSGKKVLHKVGSYLVEEMTAGDTRKAKFVMKDFERFVPMLTAAKVLDGNSKCTGVILLGPGQKLCKSKCLPLLIESGILVWGAEEDEDYDFTST
ncbi:hypothetical protein T492DRAFT_1151624 [Pavlovales sp. CCMP2436]|nr:hypothetical protein T492DRAFT_1151624 [Pavlovales sp. CCMP2436]